MKITGIPAMPVSVARPERPASPTPSARRPFDADLALQFSKHAEKRIQSREIDLPADRVGPINEAISKLEAKGARSSLVLTDTAAFIVNIRERTVVTAMNRSDLKENLFTNIDSTVVI